jgi:hypothetical protein
MSTQAASASPASKASPASYSASQEDLSAVVFHITEQGYAALRTPNNRLSLAERTVLTLVDGLCPVAQYEPFLSEFSPVQAKMRKLEQLGLLRRTGQVKQEAVKRFEQQVRSSAEVSSWQSIRADQRESGFQPFD